MRNWQAWTCTLITFTGSGTIRSSIKQLQCNAYYFTGPYLSGSDSPHFRIDEAKIAEDARSDGKWVLRTKEERKNNLSKFVLRISDLLTIVAACKLQLRSNSSDKSFSLCRL